MQENSPRIGKKDMPKTVNEFQGLLRDAAQPLTPGELVAHAIARAARRLGLTRRQAAAYWYGERKTVPADLIDRARNLKIIEAKNELAELDARIARLEALLVQDADFYRHQVDAVRAMAGSQNRTMDGGMK